MRREPNRVRELHDTALDDLLEAAGDTARLSTDDGAGGWAWLYEVVAFDHVKAFGTPGGTDTKEETSPVDFVLETAGTWV